jgi:hypothetical protein
MDDKYKIGMRYGCSFEKDKTGYTGAVAPECSCKTGACKEKPVVTSTTTANGVISDTHVTGTGYPVVTLYGVKIDPTWVPPNQTVPDTWTDTKVTVYPQVQEAERCATCKTVEVLQMTIQTLLGMVESLQLQVEQLSRPPKTKKPKKAKRKVSL